MNRSAALCFALASVLMGCSDSSNPQRSDRMDGELRIEWTREVANVGVIADAMLQGDSILWIADRSNRNVRRLNVHDERADTTIGVQGEGPGEFVSIAAIAVLEDAIFVSDPGQWVVSVFSPAHRPDFRRAFRLDGHNPTEQLIATHAGLIGVVDGPSQVAMFDENGSTLSRHVEMGTHYERSMIDGGMLSTLDRKVMIASFDSLVYVIDRADPDRVRVLPLQHAGSGEGDVLELRLGFGRTLRVSDTPLDLSRDAIGNFFSANALVNGFGATNDHLIVSRYVPDQSANHLFMFDRNTGDRIAEVPVRGMVLRSADPDGRLLLSETSKSGAVFTMARVE